MKSVFEVQISQCAFSKNINNNVSNNEILVKNWSLELCRFHKDQIRNFKTKMIVNLQFADLYGGDVVLSASVQLDQKNPLGKTLLNCLMGHSRLQLPQY